MICPRCGAAAPNDSSTGMFTPLVDEPGVHVLREGDVVPDFQADLEVGFIYLRPHPEHGPVVVLEEWGCTHCNTRQFAHVVFNEEGRILRIGAVPLTRQTFDDAHATDERLGGIYEDLVGEPIYLDGALRPEFALRLRAKLL